MNTETLLRFLKNYLIALIAGAVAAIVGVLAYLDYTTLEELRSETETLERERKKMSVAIINADDLEEHLERMETLNERVNRRLFPTSNVVRDQMLLDMEVRNNINMGQLPDATFLGTRNEFATSVIPHVSYDFKIQGRFENLLLFLDDVGSRSPFFMVAESLSIAPWGNPSERSAELGVRVIALSQQIKTE